MNITNSTGSEPALEEFAARAAREFRSFIEQADFPCVGAKAAFNAQSFILRAYDELASDRESVTLAEDLGAVVASDLRVASQYATFIAVFRGPSDEDEALFEERLWRQLQLLNRLDAANGCGWDSSVESNPADPHFSFSFAGQALYVIGLHAKSSRKARRFNWPVLVFNPHEQFERLRADGKWKRMQETIRARDIDVQGSINPMLSDFGERSEARQYSGRAVDDLWQPPFAAAEPKAPARRCPFGH